MEELIKNLAALAVEIQQIPAPTFHEGARARFVHNLFHQEGLHDVETDATGNVYARLPGGPAAPIVLSAHLDTVFPFGTPLDIRRESGRIYGPGLGDNSLAVAGLFGLVRYLRMLNVQLDGDLWLVANVGEEGLGDLNGMRAVAERFGSNPSAYIILEGTALGQVYHRGLAVRRYRVQVNTQGGHSWVNFGRPSAIHVLSQIISDLAGLKLPEEPRTSLNVGTVSGGTSVNTIAPSAEMLLDLRSVETPSLHELENQVIRIFEQYNGPEVEVQYERIGSRPGGGIPENHPLVALAAACLEQVGQEASPNIGSTDANIPLSHGYPAVCVGLSMGKGAHTMEEYIEVAPLEKGLAQLAMLVQGAYGIG